jgi:cyclopropane fatty-acyl-phospholipid synthase-like methyltransferase
VNYRLAYSIGFHPWEDAETEPGFTEKITELFRREEVGREQPYGRALDLGCGSGIWGVQLAKRGWQVTGIDSVDKAVSRARERISNEGVEMHVVKGDVTKLEEADVCKGFRLVLDSGTFHDFDKQERLAMGRGVDAITSDDATVYLLVWPKRIRPLIRGASREEIEEAFPGWQITDIEPSKFVLPKPLEILFRPDEHWYRLRRKPARN